MITAEIGHPSNACVSFFGDFCNFYLVNLKLFFSCSTDAHYAHYRSQLENENCDYPLNVIGEWTHKILQEKNPDLIL